MDYGNLVRRSWRLSWQHRFLWILGLFVGGSVSTCSPGGGQQVQWQMSPEELDRVAPNLNAFFRQLAFTLNQRVDVVAGLIFGLVALAIVLALAFLLVSVIAQGGMARATADVALGQPTTLGQAWRAGTGLFWKYVGLGLLLIGAILALVFLAALAAGAGVLLARLVEGPTQTVVIIGEVLVGIAASIVVLLMMLILGVIVGFAQRAIAIEGMGVMEGLVASLRLTREHLGEAALAWLISVGLSIGAGLLLAVAILVPLVPLGLVAYLLFSSQGPSLLPILYSGVGILVLVAIGWVLTAIVNTYFWNYWTLVYLRFTGRLTERLEPEAQV